MKRELLEISVKYIYSHIITSDFKIEVHKRHKKMLDAILVAYENIGRKWNFLFGMNSIYYAPQDNLRTSLTPGSILSLATQVGDSLFSSSEEDWGFIFWTG